ncbi:MAG: uroporphyrinogen decarboxylase family protein [Clostridia bacterium]|nr:uroporphyrinogen decarboxylase family protein [Clostridia bacterium]
MKKQETMTHKERMDAIYHRQPTDRVPFIHRGYGFCAKNTGFAVADIYEDPEKSYLAQKRTSEQYNSDGTPFYTFVSYGSWEFGGEIKWPLDRYASGPSVAKRPVSTPADIERLVLPDPKAAGCLPMLMEFAKLQEKNGDQIAFLCGSPFTHAANLCGVETFLGWLIEEPEIAHKAMRLMTDHILSVAQLFIETFGKGRVLARSAAPSESNSLISPRHFEEFAAPYLEELHQKVLDMGAERIYCHICGEQNANLERWSKIPFGDPGMLSFGKEVTIEHAAEVFPNQIICGNLDPQIIAKAAPQEVYEQSKRVIEEGKKYAPGRFVFMSGCEIPAITPPYHIYMMQKAVEDCGWY